MPRSRLLIGMVVIFAFTATASIAHSYLDGSLEWSKQRQELVKHLDSLPKSVGSWEFVEARELDASALQMLQCYGYMNHEYWNKSTGARISVAVLYGPRGPIAVHTPDVCYSSRGIEPIGDRKVETLTNSKQTDTFWTIQFRQGRESTPHLDVWYAWSDGGPWLASDNPRFWMTDSLWKIQVAGVPGKTVEESDCKRFLQEFVPVLRASLRAGTGEKDAKERSSAASRNNQPRGAFLQFSKTPSFPGSYLGMRRHGGTCLLTFSHDATSQPAEPSIRMIHTSTQAPARVLAVFEAPASLPSAMVQLVSGQSLGSSIWRTTINVSLPLNFDSPNGLVFPLSPLGESRIVRAYRNFASGRISDRSVSQTA